MYSVERESAGTTSRKDDRDMKAYKVLSTGVWVIVVVLQVLTSQLYNSLAGPFVVPKPITCQNDELVIWLQGPAADGWLCTKIDSELHPGTVSHPDIGRVARPDGAWESSTTWQPYHGAENIPLQISLLDFGVAGPLTLLSFMNTVVSEGGDHGGSYQL